VTLEDGKLTTETHILTITYGVKMDEALFKNPVGDQRQRESLTGQKPARKQGLLGIRDLSARLGAPLSFDWASARRDTI
jgi:hypothetical protein